jgi:hypothetical protein
MQVTKKQAGQYIVSVYGFEFILQGGFGDKVWTLWNIQGTQVAKSETKAGVVELVSYWSEDEAKQQATAEACYYA